MEIAIYSGLFIELITEKWTTFDAGIHAVKEMKTKPKKGCENKQS